MNTKNQDIRWVQRFENYKMVFSKLEYLVELATERELNEIEREALIQRFEYTQELAWKVIKDFYENIGEVGIQGSRDAFKLAFERGLVRDEDDGKILLETIISRNEASHTYNEKIAQKVYLDITQKYHNVFSKLKNALEQEYKKRIL